MKRKILLGTIILLVAIQFFRPEKNAGEPDGPSDMQHALVVPADVQQILSEKCYDCHSDHTRYPWYFNVQPVAWWMAWHINDGKRSLNFSIFKTYPAKRAEHKLHDIGEMVENRDMPIWSYTVIHRNSKLTDGDAQTINKWLEGLKVSGS